MKVEVSKTYPVSIIVQGLSTIVLVLTIIELEAILYALSKRILHCKSEFFNEEERNKFCTGSFVLMSEFLANNYYYITPNSRDLELNFSTDFRLIEQMAKALAKVFEDEKEPMSNRTAAATLLVQLYPLMARYVYSEEEVHTEAEYNSKVVEMMQR